jgi:hypothetical protein
MKKAIVFLIAMTAVVCYGQLLRNPFYGPAGLTQGTVVTMVSPEQGRLLFVVFRIFLLV